MGINHKRSMQEDCPAAFFHVFSSRQAKCDSVLESPARETIQLVKSALLLFAVIMSKIQA